MEKFITPLFVNVFKRNLSFSLIFLWLITTSQQCSDTTDSCGTFPNNVSIGHVRLSLVTNIPSGAPRPFTEVVPPYLANIPIINICKSTNSTPATAFRIKIESYAQCNGVPRSKVTGCKTAQDSPCPTTNVADLQIAWNSFFKNKVTITAISFFNEVASQGHMYYAIYEGTMDIEANVTTLNYP